MKAVAGFIIAGGVLISPLAVVAGDVVPARATVLRAIHELENPRDLKRPGSRGELGAYQFRKETWRMHTSKDFHLALVRSESEYVAVLHYEWLKRGLFVPAYRSRLTTSL